MVGTYVLTVSITFILRLSLILHLDFLDFPVFFVLHKSADGWLIFLGDAAVLKLGLDESSGSISSQLDEFREVHLYILSSDSAGFGLVGGCDSRDLSSGGVLNLIVGGVLSSGVVAGTTDEVHGGVLIVLLETVAVDWSEMMGSECLLSWWRFRQKGHVII
jgi:hypothetical protein